MNHPLLVYPITLSDITKNVKSTQYTSIDAFRLDFKWLLHNCVILKRQCKGSYFFSIFEFGKRNLITIEIIRLGTEKCEKKHISKAPFFANEMYHLCCTEISDMKLCAECYMRCGLVGDTGFVSVCSTPHILLWVRFSIFPYWPVKLISIGEGPKPIKVRFFEEYTEADIAISDCFLYSKEDPNEWITNNYKDRVTNAVQVMFYFQFYSILSILIESFLEFYLRKQKNTSKTLKRSSVHLITLPSIRS